MSDKPRKTFTHFIGWIDSNNGKLCACLLLEGEKSVVHTSRVRGIDYSEDGKPVRVETNHTLYIKL